LDIIKLTEKEFLRSLVNVVRFGKPILLENVGQELDPSLESVLLKQTFKQGGYEMIKIGDDVVAYHPDLKFYIATKLPNPHYPPQKRASKSLS
jgi:dynein heavy chain